MSTDTEVTVRTEASLSDAAGDVPLHRPLSHIRATTEPWTEDSTYCNILPLTSNWSLWDAKCMAKHASAGEVDVSREP